MLKMVNFMLCVLPQFFKKPNRLHTDHLVGHVKNPVDQEDGAVQILNE